MHCKEYFLFTGLRYGPKETDGYAEGTLIEFSPYSPNSYKKWTNVIEDFITGIMFFFATNTGVNIVSLVLQIMLKS
jgi:hypothetical protein